MKTVISNTHKIFLPKTWDDQKQVIFTDRRYSYEFLGDRVAVTVRDHLVFADALHEGSLVYYKMPGQGTCTEVERYLTPNSPRYAPGQQLEAELVLMLPAVIPPIWFLGETEYWNEGGHFAFSPEVHQIDERSHSVSLAQGKVISSRNYGPHAEMRIAYQVEIDGETGAYLVVSMERRKKNYLSLAVKNGVVLTPRVLKAALSRLGHEGVGDSRLSFDALALTAPKSVELMTSLILNAH